MVDDAVKMPQPIFIISDGTGDTAEKVVRAALRQFRGHLVLVRTHPNVTTAEELHGALLKAARQRAMVVSTLVRDEMREQARRMSVELGVAHCDLIGDLLGSMGNFLDGVAEGVPGLLHQADERYFRRVEAVEFTVKCDDGKEPRMLPEADIVLVGVSRTSKTPLSTFLAHKGYKVANVPIVLDRPPPAQLFRVDQRRVFALHIDPPALQAIRRARLRAMGMGRTTNYGDIDYILAELEYAGDLFRGNPEWPVIDVTAKAVEETAGVILGILRERGLAEPFEDPSQIG